MKRLLLSALLAFSTIVGAQTTVTTTAAANPSAASNFAGTYNATTAFLAPAGSCTSGAVPFSFTADADTGMIASAANAIGFCTGGTERWTINASGAFNPIANNSYDIGTTGALPRDITIGRNFVAGGTVTSSAMPAFLFTYAGTTNATGDGTVFTVPYATSVYEQGGANFATGVFTAPITGRYLLSATVHIYGLTADHNRQELVLTTTARSYYSRATFGAGANPFTEKSITVTAIADMTVGQTAKADLMVSGGTKVVDIWTAAFGYFSGQLVF